MPKKILFIIAFQGFQPIEYSVPKKILEDLGCLVVTASTQKGIAKSSDNFEATVDIDLSEIKIDDFDGIFLIGGSGTLEYLNNSNVYKIMQETAELGKFWGGICIAPRILAQAGLLKNKKVTGWNGDGLLSDMLTEAGAYFIEESVVKDGTLITANGPASAKEWGQTIGDLCLFYE